MGAGLALLYVPTFYELAAWHWRSDAGGHGPIILALTLWMVWRVRADLLAASPAAPVAGGVGLMLGLLLYVLGRSQEIAFFEVCALVPILGGTVLALWGWSALRVLWFPIMFTLFLVPIPELLVDALTAPLKQRVSEIAESLLYAAGYPVARTGVVLTIGQYQLLVADACSGLQSMISLSALGLLYMYVMGRTSVVHNFIMLVSILPIAFFANTVRVLLLMLITFHFGDRAGQGFLHGATGILLLVIALVSLMVLDGLLAKAIGSKNRPFANA